MKTENLLKAAYLLILFFLTLSGFAQMPIFKRYYVADIPGLGWLAQFYVTHTIHYLGAALFMALTFYAVFSYLVLDRRKFRITRSGYFRAGLLFAITATGVVLVLKNFSGFYLAPDWIIGLNLAHLALVMAFLTTALICVLFKKKWTTAA